MILTLVHLILRINCNLTQLSTEMTKITILLLLVSHLTLLDRLTTPEHPQDQRHLKIFCPELLSSFTKPYTDSKEVGLLVNGVSLLNHKSQNGIDYGSVEKIEVTRSGRGYTVPPKVNVEGDATATASINGLGEVTSLPSQPYAGYSSAPEVHFTSGRWSIYCNYPTGRNCKHCTCN